ncbi:zinc ABC transporter substrate-binding protein [Clostridium tertium]|jgi:zinc/manganese transport system substrate-binding protein|uniref:metal ABC transporter substrate-binding protein n=1 Tax=Clostridium TaxID=1485 RepID=UPI001157A78A|nr:MULTISPECIES: zinc ABC transporter substrate-binding protein [Clostridium]MBS5307290.1 metal ABC transporter substrate-binding protein [Clostridium sp.]MDB1921545.1 zinc ABC transporter substrate-binding protein [Clostridium tertium]MDB1924789.1 zinc ABC transporter substrate-binding protein [Clostridium tertium]MDB1928317.1 zinc ABC transporter substrate-binding protein [Clostridium tertium]MDB1946127.1 zinc ABC transporter substrate-binding protein [Clostridium tertium]
MKKLTYALVIFTSILFLGLTFSYNPLMANPTDEFDEEKETFLNILTVNKEQYKITKALVGNKHNVEYLFSNESDMESFEVSDNVKSNILNMDLFIYNGLGYEAWINDVIDSAKNSSIGIINMSRGIRAITRELSDENKENPYYLLGFNEYKIALYNIKTALQERDIINRNYYEENYNTIIEDLDEFLTNSKEELNKHKDYLIVTDSDKFDYLFKDLGIQVKKIKNNEEIKNIANEIKNSKIIFIHDNKLGSLDDLKSKIAISCDYIELNTEGDNNILKDNVNKIIDSIKK